MIEFAVQTITSGFILHAVQIEASFVSPFPRSKRNHFHCGGLQVSLNFSMASNQTARGILAAVFQVNEVAFGSFRLPCTH